MGVGSTLAFALMGFACVVCGGVVFDDWRMRDTSSTLAGLVVVVWEEVVIDDWRMRDASSCWPRVEYKGAEDATRNEPLICIAAFGDPSRRLPVNIEVVTETGGVPLILSVVDIERARSLLNPSSSSNACILCLASRFVKEAKKACACAWISVGHST